MDMSSLGASLQKALKTIAGNSNKWTGTLPRRRGGVVIAKGEPVKHRRARRGRAVEFRDIPTHRAIARSVYRAAVRAEGQPDNYLREGGPRPAPEGVGAPA
jgi:hypothetical protein